MSLDKVAQRFSKRNGSRFREFRHWVLGCRSRSYDVLVRRFGPLKSYFDTFITIFMKSERYLMNGARRSFRNDFVQIVDVAILMMERALFSVLFIMIRDLNAAMEKAGNLKPLFDGLAIEVGFREDRGVRRKGNGRARANAPYLAL